MENTPPNNGDYLSAPLGYRFRPNDKDLIDYLLKKNSNLPIPGFYPIKRLQVWEENVFAESPDVITGRYPKEDDEMDESWYFFTKRSKMPGNAKKPSRRAGSGFWKWAARSRIVNDGAVTIATVNSLGYYLEDSTSRRLTKTDWMMHEYILHDQGEENLFDKYVLTEIYKSRQANSRATSSVAAAGTSAVSAAGTSAVSAAGTSAVSAAGTSAVAAAGTSEMYQPYSSTFDMLPYQPYSANPAEMHGPLMSMPLGVSSPSHFTTQQMPPSSAVISTPFQPPHSQFFESQMMPFQPPHQHPSAVVFTAPLQGTQLLSPNSVVWTAPLQATQMMLANSVVWTAPLQATQMMPANSVVWTAPLLATQQMSPAPFSDPLWVCIDGEWLYYP